MKHILLITLTALLYSVDEVPFWVMSGILAQESNSYYDYSTGTERIVYVDRKVGAAGELSAYQITRIAWRQVRRRGERFETLATDQRYAEQIAMRYLCWLYEHSAKGSWDRAVEYYNKGPGNRSPKYLALVKAKAAI